MHLKLLIILTSASSIVFAQFGHFGARQYSYEQPNKVFLKLRRDPVQARPTKPTPDNLFSWLNLRNAVRFHLWTRENPDLAQELRFNDPASIQTSNFDPTRLTKIIIHGYADGASEVQIGTWIIEMRDAYLSLGDVNFIAVDYAPLASFFLYFTAVPEMVGERVGEMIRYLSEKHGMGLDPLHVIGWSWGAQISGFAGNRLEGKIGRITGIDPAGPTFKFVDDDFRLDKSDAKFVDIIHVNGGKLLFWGYYGLEDSIGHVDIFPNGGQKQIGCPIERTLIYETLWCSHGRGVRYFTESILSPVAFPACRCGSFDKYVKGECACDSEKNTVYLGEHMSIQSPRGNYYLITRAKEPYGHGPQLNVTLISDIYQDIITQPRSNSTEKSKSVKTLRSKVEAAIKYTPVNDINTTLFADERFLLQNTYNSAFYPNDDILKLSLAISRSNSIDEMVDKLKNVERIGGHRNVTNNSTNVTVTSALTSTSTTQATLTTQTTTASTLRAN